MERKRGEIGCRKETVQSHLNQKYTDSTLNIYLYKAPNKSSGTDLATAYSFDTYTTCTHIYYIYPEYLKASDVKNANEGSSRANGPVQALVNSVHNPLEHSLIQSLGQGLCRELDLRKESKRK